MNEKRIPHILVVDDEAEIADMLRRILRRRFDARVHVAKDGESARRLLEALELDVVTLDYQLPDCDGLELLEEIMALESPPPVLLVTGHGDTEVESRAYAIGVFTYLAKAPDLGEKLCLAIESALNR